MTNRSNQFDIAMLRLVDAGLLATIFVAPLFMGGRGPVGKFVFIFAATFTAASWCLRQCFMERPFWRRSSAEWLLIAGFVLLILQLVPLPPGLLEWLSPSLSERLPLWLGGSDLPLQLGTWNQLSLAPEETRAALFVYLGYVMLFLVVVQRLETQEDIERVVRWIALASVGMAALGLIQFFAGSEKFLWVYDHPFRSSHDVVKGSFQNQNHFAQFLALGVGPLLWWMWQAYPGRRDARRSSTNFQSRGRSSLASGQRRSSKPAAIISWPMLAVGLGVIFIAGLLTFSRGGAIALGAAVLTCLGMYFRQKLVGWRSMAAAGLMAVLVLVALGIYGSERLASKLGTFKTAESLDELSQGRAALWAALWEASPDFAYAGSGVASHRYVYPTYLNQYFSTNFTHAESGYLSLLIETGIPGLGLMLIGIFMVTIWTGRVAWPKRATTSSGNRHTEQAALAAALMAGIAASIFHSVGDFVWYISACMSLTVIIAACSCRLFQLSQGTGQPIPTPRRGGLPAWGVASSVVVLSAIALHDRFPAAVAAPHWDQYRAISTQTQMAQLQDPDEAAHEQLAGMVMHLERVLAANPRHSRAHVRLAGLYLRAFESAQTASENPMELAQIRDAAIQSQFASREQQDAWLAVAIGDRRAWLDKAQHHAAKGVQLSPYQGEAYTFLAELSFLHSPRPDVKQAFLAQAERVRPYEGAVQFVLGREALWAGDIDAALAYWKEAFHRDPEIQSLIIGLLVPQVPAQAFIEQFGPDRAALGSIFSHYRRLDRSREAKVAGEYYLQALLSETLSMDDKTAAEQWHNATGVYEFLHDLSSAIQCQTKAVELAPLDYQKRRRLANLLMRSKRFAEAAEHLQWCLRRSADDSGVKNELEIAHKALLEQQSSVARRNQLQR